MKTWGSRIKWACTAIALSIALLCCAVFSFVFLDRQDKTANAGTLNHVGVADINDGTSKFFSDTTRDLFSRLGGAGTTYDSLKSVVDADPDKQLNSQDIRDKNDGRNVLVTFGGYNWTVTYVSKNTAGDVVATLYMADSTNIMVRYYPSRGSTGNWNDSYDNSGPRKVLTGLGNSTDVTQNEIFANFITNYSGWIELPKNMSWQDISLDFKEGNLGEDPLWLPSGEEITSENYYSVTGENIWELDEEQRKSISSTKILTRQRAYDGGVVTITGSSGTLSSAYSTSYYFIRPAFHLNLKKVNDAIGNGCRIVGGISSVTFNNTESDGKIFTSSKLDDLRQYLKVEVSNSADTNTIYKVNDYRLLGSLSSAGSRTITVIVFGFEQTFTVNVTAVALTGITASYEQGNNAFTSADSPDDLKTRGKLTVTEVYNDGSTKPCTGFTLSGTINDTGNSPITVSYGGYTATVYVASSTGAKGTIVATYTQTGTIYPTTPLTDLPKLGTLKVKINYDDGTVLENVETRPDMKIFGTLADSGKCDIWVSYDGKGGTFEVNVTAIALTGITVKTAPTKKSYTAFDRFDTSGMEIEATYNNGSKKTVYGYNFAYVGGNGSFRTGETKVVVSYTEGSVTKTVDVTGITVSKAPLTVTVNNQFLDCGESIPSSGYGVAGINVSGLKNGENLTTLLGSLLKYKSTDYDPATSANGTYVLTLDPITLDEYTVTVVDGKLNVGVKILDVTLTVTNGVYGGTNITASATAADGSTAVSEITFTYTYSGTAYDGSVYTNSTTVPTKAGEYTATATISTSGYAGSASKAVKVARAALTVTAGDMSVTTKIYDGNANATIVVNSFTGGIGADVITLTATGEFDNKNVGAGKTVNITGYALDNASAHNYFVDTANCATQLTGEITKKDVTAVITAGDCVYGGVPSVTYAVTGAVAGEDIKLALSYLNGTDSTTALKTAGVYTISAALTAEFANNYKLTSVTPDGGVDGDPVEVEITKAPLTITVYDA